MTTDGSAGPLCQALAGNGAESGDGGMAALSCAASLVFRMRGKMKSGLDLRSVSVLDSGFGPSSRLRMAGLAGVPVLFWAGASVLSAQQPWPQPSPYYAPQGGQYAQPYPAAPKSSYPQPGYGVQQGYPQQSYADPNAGQPADIGEDPGQSPALAPVQLQAPLNVQQLEQLVAPIALYPDRLVAQILAASTYPAQVVDADHWRQAQGNAPPDQIVYGANAQNWDPSLKTLTAFPQVLAELDQNIHWTIALGNAYYNQPQDVLDVIQVMRQRAQAAGNLASGPQEQVGYDQGYIQVAPANPDMVYLPAYDPWTAYGQQIQPYQGFSLVNALGSFFNSGFGSGLVRFGAGIATSAFSHSPFGLLSWGLNWLTHSLLFNHDNYYSRSTSVADWGFPHGGQRYFGPRGYGRGPDRGVTTAKLSGNGYSGGYRPQAGYGRPDIANGYRTGTPIRAGGRALRPGFGDYPGRAHPVVGNGYPRPSVEAYNRQPSGFAGQPVARPFGNSYVRQAKPYRNVSNGAGNSYGRGGFAGGYPVRPDTPSRAPQQASQGYRAPAMSAPRGGYSERGFSERGFDSGREAKSGGFRSSGGGREFKAPKAPKAPKQEKMSGGHGGHGGSFGGHRGGRR